MDSDNKVVILKLSAEDSCEVYVNVMAYNHMELSAKYGHASVLDFCL